jgi:uncharacterized membrane protein SirB2
MPRNDHILGAASNLLGISLLIIAGLHIANAAAKTLADEVAWLSALCFAASCTLSYVAMRPATAHERVERIADRSFMLGLLTLFAAIVVLALSDVR